MAARDRHRAKLLDYLGNPDNDYPNRQEYGTILGIGQTALYKNFSPADMQDIENEAYEIRKKNSTKQRAEVLKAMFSEAKTGNVSAANLFLERTEGKVKEKIDHGGTISHKVVVEYVEAAK